LGRYRRVGEKSRCRNSNVGGLEPPCRLQSRPGPCLPSFLVAHSLLRLLTALVYLLQAADLVLPRLVLPESSSCALWRCYCRVFEGRCCRRLESRPSASLRHYIGVSKFLRAAWFSRPASSTTLHGSTALLPPPHCLDQLPCFLCRATRRYYKGEEFQTW
jgi:hypothetical protein